MKITNNNSPHFTQLYVKGSAYIPMAALSDNIFTRDYFDETYKKLQTASFGRDVLLDYKKGKTIIKEIMPDGREKLVVKKEGIVEAMVQAIKKLNSAKVPDISRAKDTTLAGYEGRVIDPVELDYFS